MIAAILASLVVVGVLVWSRGPSQKAEYMSATWMREQAQRTSTDGYRD